MASHFQNAQGSDELVEGAGAALVHSLLESCERFFSKPRCGDDVVLIPLQLIKVAKILDPAAVHKGLQRLLRQSLDLHSGLAAEVDKFAYQLGRAGGILAIKLSCAAGTLVDHQ